MKAPPLTKLYFYLTEGCNMACRHCWLSPRLDRDGTKRPTLPVALFERALDEAKPLGLESVKLTGGEPLLHPSISTFIDIVRKEELDLGIETNGILLTEELAGKIAEVKSRFVSVSLDGVDAPTHEGIRGVKNSFDAACRALRLLADSGTPPQIIMTLMSDNLGQVDAMVRLAEKMGAASVKFNVLQPTGRGVDLHDRAGALGTEEILALGRRVDRELSSQTELSLIFDHPPAFRSLRRLADDEGEFCGILGILGVIATGHYALCGIGNHLSDLVFGTVGEVRLEELWYDNPVLRDLREGLPERLEGICASCLMKWRCLGVCIAQNYYRTNTFWSPYWLCESAEKAGLFPASRIGIDSKSI